MRPRTFAPLRRNGVPLINFEEIIKQVESDLELRKLLQMSVRMGVSPRRFLGLWEAALVTVYERDQADRVIKATQRYATPEWTELDHAYLLALEVYEAGLCDGCGHPLAETTKAENTEAYVAKAPVRCHRCTAQIQAAEEHERPQAEALRWPVDFDPEKVLDLEKWAMGEDMIINHEDHLHAE